MSTKASQKIRETAARLEPAMLKGRFTGSTMLTPRSVHKTKALGFWQPRAEFKVDLNTGARSLYHQPWRTGEGKIYDLHVYEAGLEFPDVCPVTLKPSSHYDVVGVRIIRRSVRFQVDVPQEKANRMATALGFDRYWFAIPSSSSHSPNSRAVHIETSSTGDTGSRAKVLLGNREYAQRFAELNNLEGGRWLAARHLLMRAAGYLGLMLCGAVVVVTGLVIYGGLRGDWHDASPVGTILAFVIGLVLLGASIYGLRKGGKGEPI